MTTCNSLFMPASPDRKIKKPIFTHFLATILHHHVIVISQNFESVNVKSQAICKVLQRRSGGLSWIINYKWLTINDKWNWHEVVYSNLGKKAGLIISPSSIFIEGSQDDEHWPWQSKENWQRSNRDLKVWGENAVMWSLPVLYYFKVHFYSFFYFFLEIFDVYGMIYFLLCLNFWER